MDEHADLAGRTVHILATFLAAADRAAADPSGAVTALGDLLLRTFQNSPEASALLDRFQREPGNPGVQTAIRGRISEGMLNRPEFAAELDAALKRTITTGSAGPRPTVHQENSIGNVAAVNANSGTVSIRQRTIKIGRLQIPFPIFGLLLLLGGGAVIGGGVAIVNATSSDAGEYSYYNSAEGSSPELTYLHWTTQSDGGMSGQLVTYKPGSVEDGIPVALSGHQDGNKVSCTATFIVSVNFQGTIKGDTLTVQGMSSNGVETLILRKTTPEAFGQILNDFKKQHPSPGQ